MEKLSKFKDVFNRENLKKGVKIMALGTVLALTPMAFTGCQQPTGGDVLPKVNLDFFVKANKVV